MTRLRRLLAKLKEILADVWNERGREPFNPEPRFPRRRPNKPDKRGT